MLYLVLECLKSPTSGCFTIHNQLVNQGTVELSSEIENAVTRHHLYAGFCHAAILILYLTRLLYHH